MTLYQIEKQMAAQVIADKESYTFSDYFKLNAYVEDVVTYFGYSFELQRYVLPASPIQIERLQELKNRLQQSFFVVNFSHEIARREFLIAPILFEVAQQTTAKIRVEYPLNVNEKLKGTLDYFLRSTENLLIVEAKNGDLERGFTQLAAELIALDQWDKDEHNPLFGAVTVGNIWQFGVLDRANKKITQDLTLYRVPDDLENLLQILVAILKGEG